MTTLEDHNKQNRLLANSLVIKLTDAAIAVNIGLRNSGEIVLDDKKTWKHFLNISGQRHKTNNDVKINVLENNTLDILSKELLNKYPYTKAELLKNDLFYSELINRNRDEYTFIHGCMYPVTLDKVLSAKEGTILAYNTTLVEPNEYNLIKEIESYIKSFISRWHIKEYSIIEELYLPSMIGVLYSTLPAKILNLRLEKMLTSEVHSFHVEHMLRSNLDIYDSVNFLTKDTIIWLYKNIEGIRKSIGKESNFKLIVNKLLTANNIGVGKYNLYKSNPVLEEKRQVAKSKFQYGETKVLVEGLNNYLTSRGSSKNTLTVVVDEINSLATNELTELEKINLSNISTRIDSNMSRDIKITKEIGTKIVEVETYKYFKRYGPDLIKIILDYLINGVKNDTFKFNSTYVEPNDNLPHKITAKGGLLMLVKILLHMTDNQNAKVKQLNPDLILYPDGGCLDDAYKFCLQDLYLNKFFPDLKQLYPLVNRICYSNLDVEKLIREVEAFFIFAWTLDVNAENSMVSSNLKYLLNLCTQKEPYVVSNKTNGENIDVLLKELDIYYNIKPGWNLMSSLTALVKTLTNVDLDELATIRTINTSFKTLVTKLVAYTTQILTSDVGDTSLYVFYNNTNLFRSKTGVARIDKADILALEENYVKTSPYGNNFFGEGYNMSYPVQDVHCYEKEKPWDVKGYIRNVVRKSYPVPDPTFHVEVYDAYAIGENQYPYKEPVLVKDLKISITSIEKEYIRVYPYSIAQARKQIAYGMLHDPNVRGYIQSNKLTVEGMVLAKPSILSKIAPTIIAHVIDEKEIGPDPSVWKEPELLTNLRIGIKPLEEAYIKTTTQASPMSKSPLYKYATQQDHEIRSYEQLKEFKVEGAVSSVPLDGNILGINVIDPRDLPPDISTYREPPVLTNLRVSIKPLEEVYPFGRFAANHLTSVTTNKYATQQDHEIRVYTQPKEFKVKGAVTSNKVSSRLTGVEVIDSKDIPPDMSTYREPPVLTNLRASIKPLEEVYPHGKSYATDITPTTTNKYGTNQDHEIRSYEQLKEFKVTGSVTSVPVDGNVVGINVIDEKEIGPELSTYKEPEVLKDVKIGIQPLEEDAITTHHYATSTKNSGKVRLKMSLFGYPCVATSFIDDTDVKPKQQTQIPVQPATASEIIDTESE